MSDYLTPATRNSFKNLNQIDSRLLHEPITRDMLLHEPYTPESVDSHSPQPEKEDDEHKEPVTHLRRNSVTPEQLKSRLESYIMHEMCDNERDLEFRGRTMSEVAQHTMPGDVVRCDKKAVSLQRLSSHWFDEYRKNDTPNEDQTKENKHKLNCCTVL